MPNKSVQLVCHCLSTRRCFHCSKDLANWGLLSHPRRINPPYPQVISPATSSRPGWTADSWPKQKERQGRGEGGSNIAKPSTYSWAGTSLNCPFLGSSIPGYHQVYTCAPFQWCSQCADGIIVHTCYIQCVCHRDEIWHHIPGPAHCVCVVRTLPAMISKYTLRFILVWGVQ